MRKIARILQGIEVELAGGRAPDARVPVDVPPGTLGAEAAAGVAAAAAALARGAGAAPAIRRSLRGRQRPPPRDLLRALHAEPAEWDLVSPATGPPGQDRRRRPPMAVYLEDVRSPFNVGSIFRTAEAFGAERILLSPRTPLPTHPRALRTSLGATRRCPGRRAELPPARNAAGLCPGAGRNAAGQLRFPPRGIVLVGSEELGLSPEALRLADGQAGQGEHPPGRSEALPERLRGVWHPHACLARSAHAGGAVARRFRGGIHGRLRTGGGSSSTNRTPRHGWNERNHRSLYCHTLTRRPPSSARGWAGQCPGGTPGRAVVPPQENGPGKDGRDLRSGICASMISPASVLTRGHDLQPSACSSGLDAARSFPSDPSHVTPPRRRKNGAMVRGD